MFIKYKYRELLTGAGLLIVISNVLLVMGFYLEGHLRGADGTKFLNWTVILPVFALGLVLLGVGLFTKSKDLTRYDFDKKKKKKPKKVTVKVPKVEMKKVKVKVPQVLEKRHEVMVKAPEMKDKAVAEVKKKALAVKEDVKAKAVIVKEKAKKYYPLAKVRNSPVKRLRKRLKKGFKKK